MNFPRHWTKTHMDMYDFISFLNKEYLMFEDNLYAFYRWQDAVYDYLDIGHIDSGSSYALRKPDNMTPRNWINDYIEDIFQEFFPNEDVIYLDA